MYIMKFDKMCNKSNFNNSFKRWSVMRVKCFFFLFRYNTLFRHLLNVKRTQQDLQHVWALHMGTKHQTSHFSHMTNVWLLRMHMAFLVDNLQYYLQVKTSLLTLSSSSLSIIIIKSIIIIIIGQIIMACLIKMCITSLRR